MSQLSTEHKSIDDRRKPVTGFSSLGTDNGNSRFRFEPFNRLCLGGYSATAVALTLIYVFELDGILLRELVTYISLTLGFHSVVQWAGRAGYLNTRSRNFIVQQMAMTVWLISFTYACFFISDLRPVLLLGSFLTLNFYVGHGQFKESIGLSIVITIVYMTPAIMAQSIEGEYPWWGRDGVFVLCFLGSSLHAATVARYNGSLRKAVHQAKIETDRINEELNIAHEELKYSSESALKKALSKAEKANKMKGELLANMSHEFRTPLNAIINIPKILKASIHETPYWKCGQCGANFNDDDLVTAQGELPPKNCPDCDNFMEIKHRGELTTTKSPHELLDWSKNAGDYLLYCFDNIMNLSLIEAGDIQLSRTVTHLDEVVGEVLTSFRERSVHRGRGLRMDLKSPPFAVHADPNRVREIVSHLVDNALRFSSDNTEIVVLLEPQAQSHMRVSVVDQGIGIADSAREIIFESFQQADTSHTRSFDGLGLGLTLASGLVSLHHSELEFISEEGGGSTFFFELPACPN